VSYAAASEAVAERLGRGWSLRRLFLDHAGAEPTRTRLLEAINDGTALVNFVGHSSPTSWTPQAILGVKDVRELGNADCPAVVIQWACWNTYYVSPEQDGLGVALLLSPAGGAAATLGATALSGDVSQNALARHLAGELARPGVRLGAAVLAAKRALAAERPGAADVQYGWTLLGDPALIMPP
jgi:hypothetical protein